MSAADALEQLEAEAWQILGEYSATPRVHHVDRLITLARTYASAYAQEEQEGMRQRRRAAYLAAQRGDVQPCGTPAAARRHRRHGDVPPGKKLRDVCVTCADGEVADYHERTGRPS